MKIERVHIQNYRSILDLDFRPGDLCTLIGENNAGKSNILRALNLVLGQTWPGVRSFDDSDFYGGDVSRDISIDVYFSDPWEEERNGRKLKVAGFRLKCHTYRRASGRNVAGDFDVDFVCIGPRGGVVKVPPPGRYSGQGFIPPLTVSRAMRERTPLLYVDVSREFRRHQASNRWSVLRRLIDHIHTEFKSNKDRISVTMDDGSAQKMKRQEAFDYYMTKADSALKTDEMANLESRLETNALEQMGLDSSGSGVSIGFSSRDPANAYRRLTLLVDQLGFISDATDVGAGLQSAIVVAIFRTYEELQTSGAIFAIEEPEAFLHPQKSRYFAEALERISEQGNQVILTSHSPAFVRLHSPQTIAVVRRTQDDGTRLAQSDGEAMSADVKSALKVQTAVNAERAEMFFARKVLLVEGDTERIAIPFVFDRLGINPNREGISVVECGGKTGIPMFAELAKRFEISFVVLTDADPDKNPTADKQIRLACPEEDLFTLNPDFEGECGYEAHKRTKVMDAYNHFHDLTAADVPQVIRDCVSRLMNK